LNTNTNAKINDVFENVIGYDSQKLDLSRFIDILNNEKKYNKIGVKTPVSILLYGDPGLGKTMISKCLLNGLNRPTFILRKDESKENMVDAINKVFEDAFKESSAAVLLDDVDKFSDNDSDHPNSEEFITIQTWIDRAKNSHVFIILTANSIDELPDSLLRRGRIDKHFEFKQPNREDSEKIIKYYLSQKKNCGEMDYQEITDLFQDMSPVEIESYINEAAIYTGYDNKTAIDMDDIIRVYLHSVCKVPEVLNKEKEEFLEEASYFNAGTVVVQELNEPGSVCLCSVLNNYNGLDGTTVTVRDKNYWFDKKYMENRIMMLLAPRASYELKYGTTDIDSDKLIDRAYYIIKRFVEDYGCDGMSHMCLPHMEPTEQLRSYNENQVLLHLSTYYDKTKKLLTNHRDLLDNVAAALQDKKTLRRKDISVLMGY